MTAAGERDSLPTNIPLFDRRKDPDGVASLVPHMDHFYDNSQQTGIMRDLAIDMEILGEHLVLLGNQVRSPLCSLGTSAPTVSSRV